MAAVNMETQVRLAGYQNRIEQLKQKLDLTRQQMEYASKMAMESLDNDVVIDNLPRDHPIRVERSKFLLIKFRIETTLSYFEHYRRIIENE